MKKSYYQPTMHIMVVRQQSYLLTSTEGISGEISGYSRNTGGGFSQTSSTKSNSTQTNEWEDWK